MSEVKDAKKDDAKKDDHGEKKKTLVQQLVSVSLMVVAILVFAIVTVQVLAPEAIAAFGHGLGLIGNAFQSATVGIDNFFSKGREMMSSLLRGLIFVALGLWAAFYLKEALTKKKEDEHH